MQTKDSVVFLRVLQAMGKFKNVPVLWRPSKRGPAFRIVRGLGSEDQKGSAGRIVVELNIKGLSIPEIEVVVNTVLGFANEMYRNGTSATVIASEAGENKADGISWEDTKAGMIHAWREEVGEFFDRMVEA